MGAHPSHLIKPTTLDAFQEINANGLLRRTQLDVYNAIYASPTPVTASEVTHMLMKRPQMHPSYHPALTALAEKGVIRSPGKRACRITGYQAEEWEVQPHLPAPIPKKIRLRPTDAEMKEALNTIITFADFYETLGVKPPDSLEKLIDWIAAGAP